MRRGFDALRGSLNVRDRQALGEASGPVRRLNWVYRTRLPVARVRSIAEAVLDEIDKQGWSFAGPPALFGCSQQEEGVLAEFVPRAMDAVAQAGVPGRPYSFVTKLLHFRCPDSFPICDSQAATSIQMWSYAAFEAEGEQRDRFEWGALANTSGGGYKGVLEFYRRFWDAASESQRSRLAERAREMEGIIHGRVTTLDLVDKLLWSATGDPLRLGLRVVAM